jgi:hypothetical protein
MFARRFFLLCYFRTVRLSGTSFFRSTRERVMILIVSLLLFVLQIPPPGQHKDEVVLPEPQCVGQLQAAVLSP